MKAARLHAPRDIRIEEIPTPRPAAGEVLVRVRAVSICASDWRLYTDGHSGGVVPDHPIIQGHEFAGDVVALGEGVTAPSVGTRVAVEPSWHCGRCDQCQRGYTNICRNVVFPSFPPRDGALAEYIACPVTCVCPLPETVSYAEGALVEPLGVAIHAVRLARPQAGERIVILGAGAIGTCTLLVLKAYGCSLPAVVEPVAGRREWPARLGAAPLVADYQELLNAGIEADIVFECSGDNAALAQAMRLARPAGRVMMVGIPQPEQVSFDASVARRRELTVVFTRRSRDTLTEAVGLAATGRVDLAAFPIRRYSLAQAMAAMEATGARPGDMLRAVVFP
jgi:L-iditol 2-dehydrogenase